MQKKLKYLSKVLIYQQAICDKNVWYKIRTSSDRYYYELFRINQMGDCLEFVFSPKEYPAELHEAHPNYRIYYKL